jgi:hypothetical protein
MAQHRGPPTTEERVRITELQDALIERFVEHKEAVADGQETRAKELQPEIDGQKRSKNGPPSDRLRRPSSTGREPHGDRGSGQMLSRVRSMRRPCDFGARGLPLRRRRGLLTQRLDRDRHHPGAFYVQYVGSTRREVKDAPTSVWTPVVDFDDDRATVVEVRHRRMRGQRK